MNRLFVSFTLALCLVTPSLIGCVDHSHGGYFDDRAFYSVRQHYRVRYLEGEERARLLLGSEWRFARPVEVRDGLPRELRRDPSGADWVRLGPRPTVFEPVDLRFTHRGTGATIVVRTVPLDEELGERELPVLFHEILEAAARPQRDARTGTLDIIRTVYEGAAIVGDTPAYQAIIEGAALSPYGEVLATSTDRAFLVLARPSRRWYAVPHADSGRSVPMVVAFWFVARQERFDELVPAFRSLLDRTDFASAD